MYIYMLAAKMSERKIVYSYVERTSREEFQGMKLRNEKNNIYRDLK